MPAWVDGVETTPQWKDLIQQLKYSESHGLDPASYGVAEFERLRETSQTRMRGTQFPVERGYRSWTLKMTYAYLQLRGGSARLDGTVRGTCTGTGSPTRRRTIWPHA